MTAHRLAPPVAERRPAFHALHGDRFEDPYAWLRNRDDPAVRAYLDEENAYADAVLAGSRPLQDALYQEMLARIRQTDLTVPWRYRGYWYYSRTVEGLQYPIHCRKRETLDAPEEVLLDLNALAQGTPFLALGVFEVSDDGTRLAYSLDETGFREYTLRVKDLRTGELLPLVVSRTGTAAWAADGETLFYTTEDDAKRPHCLWRRRLGEAEPALVYEEPDEAFRVWIDRTRSGAYLLLGCDSHTTSEARWLPAAAPDVAWTLFRARVRDIEYDLAHQGDQWLVRINDTGRNFRLVAAPIQGPESAWVELVPHRHDVMLEGVAAFQGHLVRSERVDGVPRLILRHATGTEQTLPFPETVCEAWLGANAEFATTTVRYHYQSLITPQSVFDYDIISGTSTLRKQTEVLGGYDPARYDSTRVTARAPDGTAVPVSLVWRRDRAADGGAPLHLTGYGAYGYPYPIVFSSQRLSLLDRGFCCAIAHVRGGGELGKAWHDAGRMEHKHHTFTDFIAAADHLVAEGWVRRDQLVLEGGSAGGLLMGAVVNLRPDLARAVVSQVPFVDVIGTMSDPSLPLTVGEYEEWGNPADPVQYGWMRAYDPYRNLGAVPYPAMLVRTSFYDSQVMYWEPAKYVARLRSLMTNDAPVVLVTNMQAGHGGASGRYDRLREIALDYSFMLWVLGRTEAAQD